MNSLIENSKDFFTPNYAPAPFVLSHAKGPFLFDTEANKYLDFSSGIAVNNLGHCHPHLVEAIQSQCQKLMHCSNLFWNEPSMKLAKRLVENSFADQVFFTNSGTEANEAALKLARKYFFDQGKPRSKILSFHRGFHGRSFGSISATAKEDYRKPFEPTVPGFEYIDFNKMESLKKIDEKTAAVIVEPIQGEAGVFCIQKDFAEALTAKCKETGTLIIADCIQVGFYRAGTLFGYEDSGLQPDIMSLAKALGGGMPIGAMLATKQVGDSFKVGAHGSTFGGNPVAAASANAVLDVILNKDFQSTLKKTEEHLWSILDTKIKPLSQVKEVRGKGMMIGVEIEGEADPVFKELREKKLLMTRIKPSTFRILPPLTVDTQLLDEFFDVFCHSLQ